MQLGNEIRNRQGLYGLDNVPVGWVKADVGIKGNERAEEMAKVGAAKEGRNRVTEGGPRQWEKARRRDNRVKGGHLDATKWDRQAASTYTQLRTNSGNLASWKKLIGKAERDVCRWCKRGLETTTPSPTSLKTELYSENHHEEAYLFFLADTRPPWSLR